MNKQTIAHAGALAGIGLLAGFAGAAAMAMSQRTEMKLTGREPSATPAKAVEAIADIRIHDPESERQLSTAAHYAFGTALGLGLAGLAKVSEPARAAVFAAGAWSAGNGLIASIGVSDPPTRWRARQLATDIGHHLVYAAAAAGTFLGLRRLIRV